jgi:23S rRNA (adenine2030-N6)-methyltransferase
MFSYRHAFHAGNHADVLKHLVLVATLKHLTQKDGPLAVFDTHAGAGLYRLDGDYAHTSGEAANGFLRLAAPGQPPRRPALAGTAGARQGAWPQTSRPALQDYMDMVASFNAKGSHKVYPGSPFIIQAAARARQAQAVRDPPHRRQDPGANIAQLGAGRQVAVLREDGFEACASTCRPPAPRAGAERPQLRGQERLPASGATLATR